MMHLLIYAHITDSWARIAVPFAGELLLTNVQRDTPQR
jgi:hypothetical protein